MYHYYMFNKPYGCVCARTDDRYPTVMDYFSELNNPSLSPVGRLDRETEGLLFVTDDGVWNQQLTHPSFQKEKIYEFTAMGDPTPASIEQLERGVMLIGAKQPTAPAKITITGHSVLSEVLPTLPQGIQDATVHNRPYHPVFTGTITISEGKKRQIRRMFKAIGCLVIYLKRVSMDGIPLDPDLQPGEWKEITKGVCNEFT